MHHFKIVAAKDGQSRVQFVYNGEVIFWSENYKSKTSAKNCIESMKKNAPAAAIADLSEGQKGAGYRFEIVAGKSKGFFVRFVARNGETMATTESYVVKKSALNAIESAKKNGPGATVIDETVVAKAAKPADATVSTAADTAKPASAKATDKGKAVAPKAKPVKASK